MGQVGLVRTSGFWGNLIRIVTRPNHGTTHIVIHLGGNLVATFAAGAEPGGLRIRDARHYKGTIWSTFPLTVEQRRTIAAYMTREEGRPYDYFGDFCVGMCRLLGTRIPNWLIRYLERDNRWQCASIAAVAYRRVGFNFFPDAANVAVVPADWEPVVLASRTSLGGAR